MFARLPDMYPKIGFWSVSERTSLTFMSVSFHLNIKNPPCFKTRKHSVNPLANISCQSSFGSEPYLVCCQPVGFAFAYISANLLLPVFRNKCGGSKTTIENVSSSYGIFMKSACTSGLISKCRPSHNVKLSLRISWNSTRGSCLSK